MHNQDKPRINALVLCALILTGCGGGGAAGSGGSPPNANPPPVTPPPSPPPANPPLTFRVDIAGLLDGNSQGWEEARDVVRDELGNFYITGGTTSPDFPVTAGAYDTTFATGGQSLGAQGPSDAYVVKLDPAGNIIWSTYLGGPNYERAYAVEIDSAHNVYVAGRAGPGFPVTAGALQTTFAGDSQPSIYGTQDGFVSKISADGTQLLWSTYFGDAGPGIIRDLDVDSAGRVHVVLNKATANDMNRYVTANAPQKTRRGNMDTFYARLSANGATVEFGTYFGATESMDPGAAPAVRALPDGTAYVLTAERGADAPVTTNAYQRTYGGGGDLLIAKFANNGNLLFCSYLGGSDEEATETHAIEVDLSGNLLVTNSTRSANYPVTDNSTHRSPGSFDAALSILSSDGSTLLGSTLLGGTSSDETEGIGVDATGNIYVTGSTTSSDLPVTASALSTTHIPGEREGLLLVFSSDLKPRYVSYDGIPGEYGNRSMVVGTQGWTVVGTTWHLNPFPATPNQDSVINGRDGGFFLVLVPGN